MIEAITFLTLASIVLTRVVSERILRGRNTRAAVKAAYRCQVTDCTNQRHSTVRKLTTNLEVCHSCRDEMTALFGWELTEPFHIEAS